MNITVDDQGHAIVSLPLRVWVALAAEVEKRASRELGVVSSAVGQQGTAMSKSEVGLPSGIDCVANVTVSSGGEDSSDSDSGRIIAARRAYMLRALALSNLIADELIGLQHRVKSVSSFQTNRNNHHSCCSFRSQDVTANNFVVKTMVEIPNQQKEPKKKSSFSQPSSKKPSLMPTVDIEDIDIGFFSSVTDDRLQTLHERSVARVKAKDKVMKTSEPCFGFFSKLVDGNYPLRDDDDHSNDDDDGNASNDNNKEDDLQVLRDVDPEAFLQGLVGVDIVGSLRDSVIYFDDPVEASKEQNAQLHQAGGILYLLFSRGATIPSHWYDSRNEESDSLGAFENMLSLFPSDSQQANPSETSPLENTTAKSANNHAMHQRRKRGKNADPLSFFAPLRRLGAPLSICRLVSQLPPSCPGQ